MLGDELEPAILVGKTIVSSERLKPAESAEYYIQLTFSDGTAVMLYPHERDDGYFDIHIYDVKD